MNFERDRLQALHDDLERLMACPDAVSARILGQALLREREYIYTREHMRLCLGGLVGNIALALVVITLPFLAGAPWALLAPFCWAVSLGVTDWLDWRRARDRCRAMEQRDPHLVIGPPPRP